MSEALNPTRKRYSCCAANSARGTTTASSPSRRRSIAVLTRWLRERFHASGRSSVGTNAGRARLAGTPIRGTCPRNPGASTGPWRGAWHHGERWTSRGLWVLSRAATRPYPARLKNYWARRRLHCSTEPADPCLLQGSAPGHVGVTRMLDEWRFEFRPERSGALGASQNIPVILGRRVVWTWKSMVAWIRSRRHKRSESSRTAWRGTPFPAPVSGGLMSGRLALASLI